jgi:alkanesulfonate monooxygenase SsuD/methylene tetrahydromethanopterin reductase-like flavin-dependent oxidoreductase (luciferase family)
VRVGITTPMWGLGGEPLSAASLTSAAQRIERIGFDSIWLPDTLNRGYVSVDPLTAAAAIAVATERIEIGTAVLQVGRHHGVDLAHRLLTLSMLSDGRFTLGAGAGSTKADFDATDADFEMRFKKLRSNLEIIATLLSGEPCGEVDLHPWPDVIGKLQIIVGSWAGSIWIEKAARQFDGWMGSAAKTSLETLAAGIIEFRRHHGKRAIAANLRVDLSITDAPDFSDNGLDLRCTPGQATKRLKALADLGFDDAILTVFDHSQEHLEQLRDLLPRNC